ncbi:uncharacterized protein LOC106729243 isoform X2 [Camelus ferus]|uniref:Uncharacterized protein LOC106729243 isoform X2 n=1 Tax=Camelus ferus TaxID=419612 RepID=A0A8B8SE86_CAMFR|nr:uncharacterized protein LOC106729243 isoform X2 [Camelus ferus]
MDKVPGLGRVAPAAGAPGPGTLRASQQRGSQSVPNASVRSSRSAGQRDCAHFERVRECSRVCVSELPARRGGKGIPNASGAEPSTHRARPGAHSELQRHGRSRREPRRARSAGDPPELRHGAPPPPKTGGSSPIKKKEPTTFFKEKENPKAKFSAAASQAEDQRVLHGIRPSGLNPLPLFYKRRAAVMHTTWKGVRRMCHTPEVSPKAPWSRNTTHIHVALFYIFLFRCERSV